MNFIVPLSLPPAPPLTLDNILNAVKNVWSWHTLGRQLYPYSPSKLDDIQQRHDSDEACLKALIESFLSGEGYRYNQPSWRAVIWSLYEANEIQLAEHIRSFAEPVQGNEFYYWYWELSVAHLTRVMLVGCGSTCSSVVSLCICIHLSLVWGSGRV